MSRIGLLSAVDDNDDETLSCKSHILAIMTYGDTIKQLLRNSLLLFTECLRILPELNLP